MGQTADELREQLEYQRADLTRDVQAIGDRVSPGRMVDRRRAATRQRWDDIKCRVMGTTDDLRGGMADHAHGMADTATEMAHDAGETIRSVPEMARRETRGAPLLAGALAFGMGAMAAMMLPSSEKEREVVRRYEDDLSDVAEGVKGQVTGVAKDTASNMKGEAQAAVQDVKESAMSAADQVKQEASSAAGDVSEQARGATQEVKGASRS